MSDDEVIEVKKRHSISPLSDLIVFHRSNSIHMAVLTSAQLFFSPANVSELSVNRRIVE